MYFKNYYPNVTPGYKSKEYPGVKKLNVERECSFCNTLTDWYDYLTFNFVCCKKCFDYMREKQWFGGGK